MTKSQSILFKGLIFLVGLGVIGLSFFLFGPKGDEVTAIQKYIWINITVLYIVLFIPAVFSTISSANVASKIPNLTLGISALIGFEILNIALTVAVGKEVLAVRIGILIEAISFFILLIVLYIVYFASSHIASTEAKVEQSLSLIKNIRSSMQILAMKADSMGPAFAEDIKKIKALEEEVRWMAPVNAPMAIALEGQIMGKIDGVSAAIDAIAGGSDAASFKTQLVNLDSLVKQRKMIVS
ncbi:MAG: hypothetical protein MJ162_05785 [Treponema sp.]|nr:hypothetical protein [Treponema sp.]